MYSITIQQHHVIIPQVSICVCVCVCVCVYIYIYHEHANSSSTIQLSTKLTHPNISLKLEHEFQQVSS